MEILDFFQTSLSKSFVWSGRAQRKEFWYFVLMVFLANIAVAILCSLIAGIIPALGIVMFLPFVVQLGLLPATLAVSVRRLHDIGLSAWWLLIGFVPVIGFFALLYFYIKDSNAGENAYGPNPKAVA